jgi:hypothetical protein
MANLITEGWDWFLAGQNATQRAQFFAANGWYPLNQGLFDSVVPDVITGRFDFGKAMRLVGASGSGINQFYAIPLGGNKSELYGGQAVYWDAATTYTTSASFSFFDAINNHFQIRVTLDKYGIIRVWRGPTDPTNPPYGGIGVPGSATLLATSAMGSFQENEWFWLEVHALIASSGGGVEVRVNTVPKIQLTGANTQGSSISTADSVAFGWQSAGAPGSWNVAFDDMYVNDTTGSKNNSWNGNVRVKTQFMIADGAENDFIIGGSSPAATRWQSVGNQLLSDAKFVYSPNVGDKQLFVPDPNLNSPLVRCVQVRTALRQDDATQRVARHLLRIGGTDYEGGVDHYTNQTFTMYRTRWETNPDTGVDFTGADVNGLQAGLKVQA